MSRYSELLISQGVTNYWPLDESSGAATFTASVGGVSLTPNSSGVTSGVLAVVNSGVQFSGSNNSALISASNASMTFDPAVGFSFSWLMVCSGTMTGSGAWGIISRRANSSNGRTFGAFMQGSTGGTINIDYGTNQMRWDSGFVPVQGNYYHCAAVYNPTGSTYTFYVNGNQFSTISNQAPLAQTASAPLYVGALGNTPANQLFPGVLDEIAVWSNKALSPQEIKAQYATAFPITRVFNGTTWNDADKRVL